MSHGARTHTISQIDEPLKLKRPGRSCNLGRAAHGAGRKPRIVLLSGSARRPTEWGNGNIHTFSIASAFRDPARKFLDQCKIISSRRRRRRNRRVPATRYHRVRAAPDGGDGGRGGDIVFAAVAISTTLIDYRYPQHFRAQTGRGGAGRNRTGAMGEGRWC